MKTNEAFVLIHFGNNIKYLEYELYFIMNLKMYTKKNIIYLYSVNDTPKIYVNVIKKYVYKCISYDDNNITYNIPFTSVYTSFNTLRTCNFIFAYLLIQYKKICILESDMIIVKNIDNIFQLNTPSVHNFISVNEYFNNPVNENYLVTKNKNILLDKCAIISDSDISQTEINGGVMLIEPNKKMFINYLNNLKIIIERGCKYPNETLFVYTNPIFYNMPIKYNFTHFILKNFDKKPEKLKEIIKKENLLPNQDNIVLYHYNESPYKYLEIIKDNWLELNKNDRKIMQKYKYYSIPILFFKKHIYNKYNKYVNKILYSIIDHSNNNVEHLITKKTSNSKSNSKKISIKNKKTYTNSLKKKISSSSLSYKNKI